MCRKEKDVVVCCNIKENADLIAEILDADSQNKKYKEGNIVLKCYKRAVAAIFEPDKHGKREIDKIMNVATGHSLKNLKQLKAAYDKNPEQFLKAPWIHQLSDLFYSHDLLRDIIAMMVTVEKEVVENERIKKSDA